jgi:hypothetical protein
MMDFELRFNPLVIAVFPRCIFTFYGNYPEKHLPSYLLSQTPNFRAKKKHFSITYVWACHVAFQFSGKNVGLYVCVGESVRKIFRPRKKGRVLLGQGSRGRLDAICLGGEKILFGKILGKLSRCRLGGGILRLWGGRWCKSNFEVFRSVHSPI